MSHLARMKTWPTYQETVEFRCFGRLSDKLGLKNGVVRESKSKINGGLNEKTIFSSQNMDLTEYFPLLGFKFQAVK